MHRFIEPYSSEYKVASNKHLVLKDKRTKALNKVKDYAKDSPVYAEYSSIKNETNRAWKELQEVKKEERILGFKSLHFFLERFGLAVLIFTYALFNLIRSFYYERKNISSKVFHTFILSVSFFYFFWIFNTFQDFSKFTYFLMTIVSAVLLTVGVYLFTKYKQSRINKLKADIRQVSKFAVLNTKPSKMPEMFDMMENLVESEK